MYIYLMTLNILQWCLRSAWKDCLTAEMLRGSWSFTSRGGSRCGLLLSPSVANFASLSASSLPSTSSWLETYTIFSSMCQCLFGSDIQLAVLYIWLRICWPGRDRMCIAACMTPWLSNCVDEDLIPLSLCSNSRPISTPTPSTSNVVCSSKGPRW